MGYRATDNMDNNGRKEITTMKLVEVYVQSMQKRYKATVRWEIDTSQLPYGLRVGSSFVGIATLNFKKELKKYMGIR